MYMATYSSLLLITPSLYLTPSSERVKKSYTYTNETKITNFHIAVEEFSEYVNEL